MPAKRNTEVIKSALVRLLDAQGPATKRVLAISDYYLKSLLAEGVVAQVIDRETGKPVGQKVINPATGAPDRGHPANLYKLTPKGRKRAQRAKASLERGQAA